MSCYFIDKSRGTQLLWGKFGYLYRKSRRHDWSGRPLRAVSESPLGKFMDQLLFLLNLYHNCQLCCCVVKAFEMFI